MKKTDVSPRLYAYLEEWHKTSTGNQRSKGVDVDLPFEDFLNLFTRRQLNSLQKAIDTNRLRYQQDKTNKFAFVLSWVSYSARSSNKMNKDTACICSRMKSARINLPQSGDVLREGHKQAISASLTDKEKTVEHKQAISQATKGVPKAPWSEQRKRERRELIATKKAAKLDATRRVEEDAWTRVQSLQRSEPPENA